VRWVVNTHWHWDHNIGNAQYREVYPNAAIISTAFTRQSLIEWTPPFLQFFRTSADTIVERGKKKLETNLTDDERAALADDLDDFEAGIPEMRTATFVAPDTTFESSMTIHLGKREVRIFTPGKANTAGDAVVYVPDAKVLVTGDLVVFPTPYATSAYFTEWIAALKTLGTMDATTIVPGHGPVQRDKTYMTLLTQLLESVVMQVASAVQEGLSLEETQKRIDLEGFRKQLAGEDRRRNRAFREYFLTPAIATAYKQAKGEVTKESPFGP
jgi:glyoxylase-like metal-dependent hydrolase (beta-lactamase superfamily II)